MTLSPLHRIVFACLVAPGLDRTGHDRIRRDKTEYDSTLHDPTRQHPELKGIVIELDAI